MTRALAVLALVAVLAPSAVEAQCAMEGARCMCGGYDLTDVQTATGIIGAGTQWGDWVYQFDLCTPLIVPADCSYWGITASNALRVEDYPYVPECESLSSSPATTTAVETTNGLIVTMTDSHTGTVRSLAIDFTCATATDPAPTSPPAAGNAITMSWATTAACGSGGGGGGGSGGGGDGGLSFGWAFMITCTVAGVVYTGGGWYYNHKQKNMEGKEALPHADFWATMLPGLVKDGIYYTRNQLSTRWPKYFGFMDPGPGGPPSGKAGSGDYGRLPVEDEDAALDIESPNESDSDEEPKPKPKKKSKKKKKVPKTPKLEDPKE